MDRTADGRAKAAASADAALVEAARGAPAAFYQFRLTPSGAYAVPFASPDFLKRLGLEPGSPEETAARFFSHVRPDDLGGIRDAIARSARTLETFAHEFRYVHPKAGEIWIEARSNPRRTPDDTLLWDGVITDVTARRAAEAALRESEERYRTLFAANPQPMWVFDVDTLAFLEVNDAAVAHYGYGRDEFLAMTIADIRPPEDIPRLKGAVGRVAEGAIDNAGVWRHRKKDGTIILVEITSHATRFEGRQAEVVLVHDITARLKAEAALRESQDRFRAMFESAPIGVAQADPATGRWVAVNPRMRAITGYSGDELLEKRVPELTHPDDRARDWELFQTVVSGEAPEYRLEKRYVRKDGTVAWVNVNMIVLRDADGKPTRTVGFIEDITERKETEENVARLNAELEDALDFQKQIFEGSRDAVFLSDAEGRFVAVNHAAEELTGHSRADLLSMSIPDLHDDVDLGPFRAFHARILAGERILSEAAVRRKDGTKVPVEFNNSRVLIGGRTLVHTAGRDVTERTRATRRLTLQAEMGRVLAEASSLAEALPRILRSLGESEGMTFGAWWELDAETGALRCAHTWCGDGARCTDLDGATRALEVRPGQAIPGVVWASRRPCHEPAFDRSDHPRAAVAARAGLHAAVGFPLLRDDEVVAIVEFFAPEIRSVDAAFGASVEMLGGQVALYLERNRAQEASARFLAGSPAVLYALRPSPHGFRSVWFSENIESLTGYAHAEVLTSDAERWWREGIHPGDLPRVVEANRSVLEAGHATVEFRFRHKDGAWLWIHDEKRVLVDPSSGLREVVGSWVDVTARVSLEEQLRQAQKMEAVGQLAGGVAHDFNNLLTVISGNCDLLLGASPADDPKRGALSDIRAAGNRAANLTRQLLAFSRKQILEPRLVDVHEVVAGLEKMLRRLIGEDVLLATDLAADPSWVKVDPGQLEQVIMNLAVNARDAMPRGGSLTIRTRSAEADLFADADESTGGGARPRVALSISDTGAGISPEARPHIFEPFFTTKEVGKGTGLGLATVYGIVKQSGGDIAVESEPGRGATFTILLPSHPRPRGHVSGASHAAIPRGTETVLVVEDEDAVRRIVKIALESTGYRVVEARSGPEALEAARVNAGGFRAVVTDVVMPGMSGRELAERLRRDRPDLKVLYMSGYTDDAVMRHGIVESGVAFLQKPFSPLALARKVRDLLDTPG